MNTDKRILRFISAAILTSTLLLALLFSPNKLKAEGSVDFINNDGFRLFYFAERPQQLKVYANAGEFINFGASHVGISGGFIKVYRPDGTLHSTYNNTGTTVGQAIINNNIEELNGPTGGGSTSGLGYDPGIVQVDSGEEGVWTITLEYPFYQFTGFDNLMNSDPWDRLEDQPTNRRVVLSWDITISQNAAANEGGNMLEGRVFTNEYQSIISENGNTSSPSYFLLTNEGFQFQIDYNDVDPWGFQINSNNKGIINGDIEPTYASYELNEVLRSADINTFQSDQFYLYEPQARDMSGLINNKVFFNLPDPNMPSSAMVTDIIRNDTHTTWLFQEAPEFEVEILGTDLLSNDPVNGNGISAVLDRVNGAIINYNTNLGGNAQLIIDIDNDGVFGNNNDRIINDVASTGVNEILWDGLDQNGQVLDQQFNREISYRLTVNAGEIHLTLSDIENDLGGVTLTRLNGNSPNSEFLYDHSRLNEAVSGGGTEPVLTAEPFTFSNNFGDLRMLDYWTYVASVSAGSTLFLDVVDDITIIPNDSDNDGVRDDDDIDNDNDGILDILELCAGVEGIACFPDNLNPDFDEDFDGVPNYLDADDPAFDLGCADLDGDGICDQINLALDIDQDGVPNHLDLDSDNDGIVDILEADHDFQDTDGNGFIDGANIVFGQNGLFNPLGTDNDAFTAEVNYSIHDADLDNHPDAYDLDSDNDGIHDVTEANFGSFDLNEDGILSAGESAITVSENGLISLINIEENGNQLILPLDSDSDQIFNFRDRDSDNDGLTDAIEGRNPDGDADGVVGTGSVTVNEFGIAVSTTGNEPFTVRTNIADHDNDAIQDYRDLDSDNDGIYDVAEALLGDSDDDGFLSAGMLNVDVFGMVTASGSGLADYIAIAPDQDGDMVPNYLDRDSDNDGIHDITEAGLEDPEGDGVIGLINSTDVDSFGRVISVPNTTVSSFTTNNDGDTFPDYLDLDSDNDGINDVIEGGGIDEDGDGIIGFTVNEFGQLIENNIIATTSSPRDSDGDGVPNYQDLDSDNDGLNDVLEAGNVDPDNDGIVGVGAPSIDDNGRVIGQNGTNDSTSSPLDTDGDGIFDYEDLDSDNDGIFDVYENNLPDNDNDGVIGEGQLEVNENGQVILPGGNNNNTSNPVDTDGDGIPDFRDVDSDNDEILDAEECPTGAPCPDLDMSGIPDIIEVNSLVCPVPLVTPTVNQPSAICSTDMLSLTVNESSTYEGDYPASAIMYIWTNGDGVQIATSNDPTYEIQGDDPLLVMPLSVTVMTDVDCESSPSAPVSVQVTETPESIPSSNFNNVCIGGEVQLFAQTVPGASYEWFFNSFLFSTTQNPVLMSLSGSTNFGLEVTLNGCKSTNNTVFVVADQPADIEAMIGTGAYCTGEDVLFTAVNNNTNLVGDLNYILSGPDGFMTEVTAPANGTFEFILTGIDIMNAGEYSLIVDSGAGCISNVETYTIDLTEGPEQPQIFALDDNVCSGDNIMLTSTMVTGTGIEYTWILNGSTVGTTSTPEFIVPNATIVNQGNYQVQVSAGGCGVSTSSPVSVSLVDTSVSPVIESNLTNDTACAGQMFNLRVLNPTAETIYTWFDPSGTVIGNGLNVDLASIQTTDAGFYTVEANINDCAIRTDEIEIAVADNLEMAEFDSNVITACEGSNISIAINNFTSTTNTTYSWFTENDVLFTTTTSPSLVFPNSSSAINGNYYVVVEQNGCTSEVSDLFNVNITDIPTEAADAGLDMILCASANVTLSADIPSQGTGMWIGSNGVIIDVNDANTEVNNLPVGTHTYIWILSTDACAEYSRDTVIVTNNNIPNETANILNTESSICVTNANNFVLNAENPTISSGVWMFVSGPSAVTFSDQNSSTTNISGLVTGTYEIAWQLSTVECGVNGTDTYSFSVDALPTDVAEAGSDLSFCQGETVTTDAIMPSVGTGQWTSNTGAVFSDLNDPNSSVSDLSLGTNILTWTLSSGACEDYAFDQVSIEITTAPNEQAAVVNDAIRICEGSDLDLESIMPSASNGSWTQVSGSPTTIVSPNSNTTTVNYNNTGTFTFAWELSTDDCGTFSSANVEVVIDEIPNEVANAGADQTVCGGEVNLSAVTSTVGQGVWTSTSGDILDVNDPNTMVSNLPVGDHTFTWTLSNGVCEDFSNAQVVISVTDLPNETAQVMNNLIEICADDTANAINLNAVTPVLSTGQWTQMAGPSVAILSDASSENTMASDLVAGQYVFAWTLSAGICGDFSSATVTVNVDEIPDNQVADAGADQNICTVNSFNLEAIMPTVGTGRWSIFNTVGASITDVFDPNSGVTLVEGENTFVWSLSNGNCENYIQDTVRVFLTTPADDAIVFTDNVEICELDVTNVVLSATAINSATGLWTQFEGPAQASIDNPTNEVAMVSDLMPGTYTFVWTLSEGACTDFASDQVTVTVSDIPNEDANLAQDEISICGSNEATLVANTLTQSTGVWTTNGVATITNENIESTSVSNLQAGANVFTWSLSNGACVDFSTADLTVFVEEGIDAVNDVYTVLQGSTLTEENVLDNEEFNGNSDWTISLLSNSPEVSFNTDGSFVFEPAITFTGLYTFEYEICDVSCNDCQVATVNINVREQTFDCDIPNVLTPNNDNKNDVLVIDCAFQLENNIIQIFNRWGDKVHEQVTYQNDWRGTYEGDDLPAGTYFYIFKMDQDENEAMTGYITIIR